MAEPVPAPVGAKAPKSRLRELGEWVLVIVAALVVAFVVKTYFLQTFYIPSGSMLPTLELNDRVVVWKLDHTPAPGEIAVFDNPRPEGDTKELIKRVVATGGDTVEGRDGKVWVNGEALPEDYLPEGVTTSEFGPVRVPDGDYWMMGDNRPGSADSREFGPVDGDLIVGRAVARIWPLTRFLIF